MRFDDEKNKTNYIDELCLYGIIYSNNNNVILYENANNNTIHY